MKKNIQQFLDLAKKSPEQAFNFLKKLNLSPEDFLVLTINAGYCAYLSDLLSVEGMCAGPKALTAALNTKNAPYLSTLCNKNAKVTHPAEGEAVLVLAIEQGYCAYLSDLLSVEGMCAGPKALTAALNTKNAPYLSTLCNKNAKITHPAEGEAVLVLAIEQGYCAYLSDLVSVKGITLTPKIIRNTLSKLTLPVLYQFYKEVGGKIDETLAQQFNARVLELLQNCRKSSVLLKLSVYQKNTIQWLPSIFRGLTSYDKNQLDQMCFDSKLLTTIREAGIFGKELLKDCLWTQLQKKREAGVLKTWLQGSEFGELINLLLYLNNQSALDDLLSIIIKDHAPEQYVSTLLNAGAKEPNNQALDNINDPQIVVENITPDLLQNTTAEESQQANEALPELDQMHPSVSAVSKSFQNHLIENKQTEELQIKQEHQTFVKQDNPDRRSNQNTNSSTFYKPVVSPIAPYVESKNLNVVWSALYATLKVIAKFTSMALKIIAEIFTALCCCCESIDTVGSTPSPRF